jgi:phenylalanyl-tRNA synthetase beta chain
MQIPWKWIKEQIELPNKYSPSHLIEKLNYLGLECEDSFDEDKNLFLNFITASNRKDLKSWWGISREICILLGINQPSFLSNNYLEEEKEKSKKISLNIKTNKVYEYNLSIIENIEVKETPKFIKNWLKKNQIRSINGIVDIANFVMLETGQPLHAFDFDKLYGNQKKIISIRESCNNEIFTDIYGKERILENNDLVVSDNEKIIDLIGIIGEKSTSISEKTRNIMIESANFDSVSIKSTLDRIKLNTKSGEIFSKEFNKESSISSLIRVSNLIKEIFQISEGKIDYLFFSNKNKENKIIRINHKYIEKKLGVKLSKEKINECLERLQFPFQLNKNQYIIIIPSYRSDISIKEDIIEEVGKILDYNSLPGILPTLNNEFIDEKFNFKYNTKKKISNYLISLGYQEVISYSLIEENKKTISENLFKVIIPKSSSHVVYRDSFIPSHIKIIKNNLRQGHNDIFIFEIGSVYFQEENNIIEKEILTLSSSGKIISSQIHSLEEKNDFYWVKGLLENIFSILEVKDIEYSINEIINNLDNNQSLSIILNGKKIGFLGKVSQKFLDKNEISNHECFVSEISLEEILENSYELKNKKYVSISYLPIIKKDISFIIDKSINLNEINELIKTKGGDFLIDNQLFDTYEKNISLGKHSVSFRLTFQGKEKNLKNTEIEDILNTIIKEIKKKFLIIER